MKFNRRNEESETNIILSATESSQIKEIFREFSPERVVQDGENSICPICLRPHYKEAGPFICGATIHKKEDTVALWVQSLGCCKWEQRFPIKKLKERQIKESNLISVIRRYIFSQ